MTILIGILIIAMTQKYEVAKTNVNDGVSRQNFTFYAFLVDCFGNYLPVQKKK